MSERRRDGTSNRTSNKPYTCFFCRALVARSREAHERDTVELCDAHRGACERHVPRDHTIYRAVGLDLPHRMKSEEVDKEERQAHVIERDTVFRQEAAESAGLVYKARSEFVLRRMGSCRK